MSKFRRVAGSVLCLVVVTMTVAGCRRQGSSDLPVLVAGASHNLAVAADGTLWAWGWNGYGQLGDGTTTDHQTPVQVPGMADVVAIAGGVVQTLALLRDGTVWAWGWNTSGQLGDGTTTDRSTPVQV